MGIFSRMFGKSAEGSATGRSRGSDFIDALSAQLRGELEPALAAYLQMAREEPEDNLAPFFAASIRAGKGETAEAAETLRSLSQRAAAAGMTITRDISLNLIALMGEEISVPAVAEIVVSFGDLLKSEGFVREAAVCFETASGLVPDNAHVLHKLGDTLHDLQLYEYAESVLREAIKCAPNHWGALYTLAVLLQDLGRFPESLIYYDRAVRLNPDHARCRNNYGAALLSTSQLPEALEQCSAAAKLDPSLALARVNLGNINLLMQQYKTARGWFKEAIALDGNLAPAYFGLGSAERALGTDSARLRELYLKAIELNPLIPEFRQALGNVLTVEGNPEALEHFATAEQANGKLKNLQREFGIACLHLGRREEGLEHLRLALEQDPSDAVAREILEKEEEAGRTDA